jgi:chromosome segregation ATPase
MSKSWNFLKIPRSGKLEPQPGDMTEAAGTDVQLLKSFDSRAIGAARDSMRVKLDEFEAALQTVSQLPQQFRMVMAPIENAVGAMALLRNRLELAEDSLVAEKQQTGSLTVELGKTASALERVEAQFKSEERVHADLRKNHAILDASFAELRQAHGDALAKVARLEPQLKAAAAARDAGEQALVDLRNAKMQSDDMVILLDQEISDARTNLSRLEHLHSTLGQDHARLTERLEESQRAISMLEGALASSNQQLSAAVAALQRERNASRALRSDNEQLTKQIDERALQFDAQLQAARARYAFVEKTLEDSRERFHEETRQLSTVRRERAQRDQDLGQVTRALEAAQRETADLRSKVESSAAAQESTSALLSTEIEQRRKLELELDTMRIDNSEMTLKLKALNDMSRVSAATAAEDSNRYSGRMTALRTENEQLRAELNLLRNRVPMDDPSHQFPDDEAPSSVVPLR